MLKITKDKKQLVHYCFYIFIAVIPFKLILAPITIGLVIASYLAFGNKGDFLKQFKENKAVWILIVFYGLHFLGLLYGSNVDIEYSRIETQLLLLIIPLVFIAINLKLAQIEIVKKVYIISWVLFCILAILSLLYNLIVNYEHRLDYNFVQTSMYHYHYPYDVLYINAAHILLLFNLHFKRYKLLFSILFFILIVLSGVRMGLAIFLLITGIYCLMNFKRFFNIKSLLALLSIIILSFVLIKNSRYANDKFFDSLSKLGFNTEQYVSDIGENYHKISFRQKLWISAKEAFNESPNKILGYGPQGSREILDEIYKNNEYDIKNMNSHSQYLTTTLNNGILGLLCLVSIFLIGFVSSMNVKSIQNALIVFIILIAFITESMLERQKGITIFALMLSLVFIENQLTKSKQTLINAI